MRRFRLPDEAGIFSVLVAVVVVFAIASRPFATVPNALELLLDGTVIAALALGQTFVLLTGGIDLSTGANVAMTGVLAAVFLQAGLPAPLAVVLAVACGTLLGVANGLMVHYLRVPAFIVTFSTLGVASSIPLIITGANSIPILDPWFTEIGQGNVLGIPIPIIIVGIAFLLADVMLGWTRLGTHIYALGGNRAAARLAGVNVARTTVIVYALSGFCAGIGGVIATSRLGVGFPATGQGNQLFYSIAAAVVGGVSLFGGVGSVVGAMIGAVLIATISDGMNVTNVQAYWQPLVIGLIILVGVAFDTRRSLRREQGANARSHPRGGSALRLDRAPEPQPAGVHPPMSHPPEGVPDAPLSPAGPPNVGESRSSE
jgi:ribose transport system permease protein